MSVFYGRIVEQALQRVRPKQIAHNLKIHPQTVHEQIRKARKIGVDIPHFSPSSSSSASHSDASQPSECEALICEKSIVVPVRLLKLLDTEAERVSKTRAELAQAILEKGILEKWARHG